MQRQPIAGQLPALLLRPSLLRLLPSNHDRATVMSHGARVPTPGGPVTVVKAIRLEVRASGKFGHLQRSAVQVAPLLPFRRRNRLVGLENRKNQDARRKRR